MTAEEFYKKYWDVDIPTERLSFDGKDMIEFAEKFYSKKTAYSQRDMLISFACKLNNVSVEQYGKYYGNKVDEFLTNKQ